MLMSACRGAPFVVDGGAELAPVYPAGVTDVEIDFEGTRIMRVYVPAGLSTQTPEAIIVVLHGGGGEGLDVSALGQNPLAVFRDVADQNSLVVVYPEGSLALDGKVGWTDCRSDNRHASQKDDVGFLKAGIAKLRSEFDLPSDRIFMAGTSNGGQMALAFAAQATEDIQAFDISSANFPEEPLSGRCTQGPSAPFRHSWCMAVPMPSCPIPAAAWPIWEGVVQGGVSSLQRQHAIPI